MYNFIRNALEILGSKPWGLKTFCVFIVDVASVGRFPINSRPRKVHFPALPKNSGNSPVLVTVIIFFVKFWLLTGHILSVNCNVSRW